MVDFKIERINNKDICIKGIGKLFYESGFPISLSINKLKEQNIEVSILHIADELLKNGWQTKTIISKFIEDFADSNKKEVFDKSLLEKFCNSSYEDQRSMLFNYLFKDSQEASKFFNIINF